MQSSQERFNTREVYTKIGVLSNSIQEYAWGSTTAIPDLLGEPEATDKPIAELWMGAHPKAPSKVLVDGEWERLNEVIERSSESVLGKQVAEKFHGKLPFLFKVLAAASPLSIQAHPNLQQACQGFARENSFGIPIDEPNRNYKDANHKPEIICAIKPFKGLKGFRKIEETLGLIRKVSPPSLLDELNAFKKKPDAQGLKRFFTSLMSMDKEEQKRVVAEAVSLAEQRITEATAFQWMIELNRAYPGDIGVLSPLYLNIVQLNPGEALYLPAGELHAYLDGLGIELMANSDNVLRGGLTHKHIDLSELPKIVNFTVGDVKKIKPVNHGVCERAYPTSAEEFLLSMISVNREVPFTSFRDRSVEIMICTEGEASIKDLGTCEILSLIRGRSVVVPAAVVQYRIDGEATLYKASVPL